MNKNDWELIKIKSDGTKEIVHTQYNGACFSYLYYSQPKAINATHMLLYIDIIRCRFTEKEVKKWINYMNRNYYYCKYQGINIKADIGKQEGNIDSKFYTICISLNKKSNELFAILNLLRHLYEEEQTIVVERTLKIKKENPSQNFISIIGLVHQLEANKLSYNSGHIPFRLLRKFNKPSKIQKLLKDDSKYIPGENNTRAIHSLFSTIKEYNTVELQKKLKISVKEAIKYLTDD